MPRKEMSKTTVKTEEINEEVKQTAEPTKKGFEPSDGITCRSVTHGILFVDWRRN